MNMNIINPYHDINIIQSLWLSINGIHIESDIVIAIGDGNLGNLKMNFNVRNGDGYHYHYGDSLITDTYNHTESDSISFCVRHN